MDINELAEFFGENLDDGDFWCSVDDTQTAIVAVDDYGFDPLGIGSVRTRSIKSAYGDILVGVERTIASADKDMESPAHDVERIRTGRVPDSALLLSVFLDNGFSVWDCLDLEFVAIPDSLFVVPKSQWVLDRFTTYRSELSEIRVWDGQNKEYRTVAFGFNEMRHDDGFKYVIGGVLPRYAKNGRVLAPMRLNGHRQVLRMLEKNNKLAYQVFNGYLLGLSENEKEALKSRPDSHYAAALRQNAWSVVCITEYAGFYQFADVTAYNEWAFKALDQYKVRNSNFWASEQAADVAELCEVLKSAYENADWRYKARTIRDEVLSQVDHRMKAVINFYNGDDVVEELRGIELEKSKFQEVHAAILAIAEAYVSYEEEEDNAYDLDEKVEDYDATKGVDYSQRRGYKKAYLEPRLVAEAKNRAFLGHFQAAEWRQRDLYSSLLAAIENGDSLVPDMENALREGELAIFQAREEAAAEIRNVQLVCDEMETRYGSVGLTAFTPASELPDSGLQYAYEDADDFWRIIESEETGNAGERREWARRHASASEANFLSFVREKLSKLTICAK